MSTILNGITHALEVLFVFLATFAIAAGVMGLFGGVGVNEARLAVVEAIAAAVLWAKYAQQPA